MIFCSQVGTVFEHIVRIDRWKLWIQASVKSHSTIPSPVCCKIMENSRDAIDLVITITHGITPKWLTLRVRLG